MHTMRLRVFAVQLNPRIGQFASNASRARALVARAAAQHGNPDLVVLPELGLTGYNFQLVAAVRPHLEERGGRSTAWAQEVSRLFDCLTLVGFPEGAGEKIYNTAVMVDRQGAVLWHYRKTHLYEADEEWGCSEGEGFCTHDVDYARSGEEPLVASTAVGICMDLNPYRFEAPFDRYEFASAAATARVVLCPMAWLHPGSPSIGGEATEGETPDVVGSSKPWDYYQEYEEPGEPNTSTVRYWVARLAPLLNARRLVVCTNRSGTEADVLYGGSTSIMEFGPGRVSVLGSLGRSGEGVMVSEVELEHLQPTPTTSTS